MPPRKPKKQPSTPAIISCSSDSGESIESASDQSISEADSEAQSDASGEELTDLEILTPSKRQTRGRVLEPPVTPTPKKTTRGRVLEPPAVTPTSKKTTRGPVLEPPETPTPKKTTRGRVLEPPVIPTPKQTPPKGTKRSIVGSSLQQESPTKKQRISEASKGKNKSVDKLEADVVYLEDLDPVPKLPELKTCGVFNKASVDPLLKKTYSKLTMLPGGKRLIGWTGAGPQNEDGFVFFSSVKDLYPEADMSYLRDLVCFDADKSTNTANLCRINPTSLCLKNLGGSSTYVCYRGNTASPTRCLLMGLIFEDRTRSAYQLSNGKWMKSLSLIPFALEADRMIAAIAVIYDTDTFHGQLSNGNIISFSTRQGLLDSSRASSSSPTKAKKSTRFAKPTSAVGSVSSASTVSGVRGPEEDIPILDARKKKIKLPDNMKDIVDTFPRFSGPVPQDSVALVCYTTSKYVKNKDIYASFNIQWAAVLCGEAESVFPCCFISEANLERNNEIHR